MLQFLSCHFSQCRKYSNVTVSNSCFLPPDRGECEKRIPRYYFATSSNGTAGGECRRFTFGGCGGNGNNFLKKGDCLSTCGRKPVTAAAGGDLCHMPADPGFFCIGDLSGSRASERYYYNAESLLCQRFVYAGCGGNGNNFSRRDKCRRRCNASNEGGGLNN